MSRPQKRVLVTGASGFIGRTLTQRLLEKQYQVNTLSRSELTEGADAAGCRAFQGDISSADSLDAACKDVDTIFHLAAYAHVNHHDTQQMLAVNVDGTRRLLDAALRCGVRRIVFFSSCLAEPANGADLTPYGQAKLDAEQLLFAAAQTGKIEVCCLRPVNVYGLGMQGNLLTMIKLIRKGIFPPLPVPSASISLVGNRDLCEAALLAAESARANGQTYVVTDGRTYTMKGIEVSVRRALGRAVPRWHMPLALLWLGAFKLEMIGKVLRMKNAPGLRSYRVLTCDSVFSCEKIQQELGYNPAATFTDELPGILQQLHRR